VLIGAIAGVAMYWLQVYAFYDEAAFVPGEEIRLTLIEGGEAEPIIAEGVTGIDSDSSPIRFRACFRTPMTQAMLTETYRIYPDAVPNVAPGWFDCFPVGSQYPPRGGPRRCGLSRWPGLCLPPVERLGERVTKCLIC